MSDGSHRHYRFSFTRDPESGGFTVAAFDVFRNRDITFSAEASADRFVVSDNRCDPALALDLLDLALAIHVADRVTSRHPDLPCLIEIELDVRREAEFFRRQDALEAVLFWLTGDKWHFTFHRKPSEDAFQTIIADGRLSSAALWSDGLDSMAGFLVNAHKNPDKAVELVAVHTSSRVYGDQHGNFRALRDSGYAQKDLFQHVNLVSSHKSAMEASIKWTPNALPRSRGLVFMLVGSAVSILKGYETLSVYENGIGAINLPFGGAGPRDHAKSVHPRTISEVSRLISSLIGRRFEIELPYLFHTKTDLIREVNEVFPNIPHVLTRTVSCDRRPRKPELEPGTDHCGWCSSCLLRRMSIAAAGLTDATIYAPYESVSKATRHQYSAMNRQVQELDNALNSPTPWAALCMLSPNVVFLPRYIAEISGTSIDESETLVVDLYRRYAVEWKHGKTGFENELSPLIRSGAITDWSLPNYITT